MTLESLPAFIKLLNCLPCFLRYEADNDANLRIFISYNVVLRSVTMDVFVSYLSHSCHIIVTLLFR